MTDTLVLFYAAAFMAISQLLFMGVSSGTNHRQFLQGKLLALNSFCLISYIVLMMPAVQSGPVIISQFFRAFAIATPAVFWLLSYHLFKDRGQVHPFIWGTIAAYITVRLVSAGWFIPVLGGEHWLTLLAQYSTQLAMLSFAAHACYLALRDARTDLVESRQRMRPIFVISMGAIISVILASGFFGINNYLLRSFYFLVIFSSTFYFNIRIFKPHQDFMDFIQSRPRASNTDKAGGPLTRAGAMTLQRIRDALYKDDLYTKPGLMIKDLASAVNMKEHQLRRFINQKLHYRNFNEFINEYRLNQAVEMLRNPSNKAQISTIAFGLGYSSPSSFNKVFKETYNMTPSEYRKRFALEPANESMPQSMKEEHSPQRESAVSYAR